MFYTTAKCPLCARFLYIAAKVTCRSIISSALLYSVYVYVYTCTCTSHTYTHTPVHVLVTYTHTVKYIDSYMRS